MANGLPPTGGWNDPMLKALGAVGIPAAIVFALIQYIVGRLDSLTSAISKLNASVEVLNELVRQLPR